MMRRLRVSRRQSVPVWALAALGALAVDGCTVVPAPSHADGDVEAGMDADVGAEVGIDARRDAEAGVNPGMPICPVADGSFEGVSEAAFRDHFMPVCDSIRGDNRVGRVAFLLTRLAQRLKIARIAILIIVRDEQQHHRTPRLSGVLWDIFSGSAPYKDIFRRMVHPALIVRGILALPYALVLWLRPRRTPAPEVRS